MESTFDLEHHYFPNFDRAELVDFAIPFCRLMFAFANCDREIMRLVSASTGKSSQEDEFRRGSVAELGEQIEKFIVKHKGGRIADGGYKKAFKSCVGFI